MTDLIEGEGFPKLVDNEDCVKKLYILDRLLSKNYSDTGNIWRNILKILLIPLQIIIIRFYLKDIVNPFIFAHSTYYVFLARFSGVRYVAFPQGSEVLVRPFRSKLYKMFARFSLRTASAVIVDSIAMQTKLKELYGFDSNVIQNGIAIPSIRQLNIGDSRRSKVTSARGIDKNYRTIELLEERRMNYSELSLSICYPFANSGYLNLVRAYFTLNDEVHGKLDRNQLYSLFKRSYAVISIPESDSSPRSVYEAIFCGAAVICSYSSYIDDLPKCMRSRLIIVDPSGCNWLENALEEAMHISNDQYLPSEDALNRFDQVISMKSILNLCAKNEF
jgi:hypothetical protein